MSDQFGFSVAFSDNATTLTIVAPYNNDNGDASGCVQVYNKWFSDAPNWLQVGQNINGEEDGLCKWCEYDGSHWSLQEWGV